MQCGEIREMLSSYIDNVLDQSDRVKVEEHIGSCGACRQELADLRETIRLVSSLGEVLPPEGFREQLMNKLKLEQAGVNLEASGKQNVNKLGRLPGWFSGTRKYAAAALIIIGLGVSMGIYQLNQIGNHSYGVQEAPLEIGRAAEKGSSRVSRDEANGDGQKLLMTKRTEMKYKADDSSAADRSFADSAITDSAVTDQAPTNKGFAENTDQYALSAPGAAVKTESTNESSAKMGVMERQKQAQPAKKIIKEANLNMEVGNYKNFGSKLTVLTEQYGGYIENSSENLESAVSANFVIRVPNSQFAELVTALEKLGRVNGKHITGRDVTSEFVDTESRLRNLQTQENRLLNLMEKTSSLSDIVTLENELGRIRGEIESLQGRLKALDDTVVYSTIRLEVTETAKVKVDPPQGVWGKTIENFEDSWVTLINFLGGVLKFTGWLLPWALVIGGTGGLVVYYRKFGKKKDNSN